MSATCAAVEVALDADDAGARGNDTALAAAGACAKEAVVAAPATPPNNVENPENGEDTGTGGVPSCRGCATWLACERGGGGGSPTVKVWDAWLACSFESGDRGGCRCGADGWDGDRWLGDDGSGAGRIAAAEAAALRGVCSAAKSMRNDAREDDDEEDEEATDGAGEVAAVGVTTVSAGGAGSAGRRGGVQAGGAGGVIGTVGPAGACASGGGLPKGERGGRVGGWPAAGEAGTVVASGPLGPMITKAADSAMYIGSCCCGEGGASAAAGRGDGGGGGKRVGGGGKGVRGGDAIAAVTGAVFISGAGAADTTNAGATGASGLVAVVLVGGLAVASVRAAAVTGPGPTGSWARSPVAPAASGGCGGFRGRGDSATVVIAVGALSFVAVGSASVTSDSGASACGSGCSRVAVNVHASSPLPFAVGPLSVRPNGRVLGAGSPWLVPPLSSSDLSPALPGGPMLSPTPLRSPPRKLAFVLSAPSAVSGSVEGCLAATPAAVCRSGTAAGGIERSEGDAGGRGAYPRFSPPAGPSCCCAVSRAALAVDGWRRDGGSGGGANGGPPEGGVPSACRRGRGGGVACARSACRAA